MFVGPPDKIIHDAGSNFSSQEFRRNTFSMAITTSKFPVETHNSVDLTKKYHAPIRGAFRVIRGELKEADKELILQMAVKKVNDTAGPDGVVPTFVAFGAYPRIPPANLSASDIVQ